ncbi:PucR family transcriptional regulator [Parasporobacterium paucivorans]|uniref:PucR C-terminal helix-turn-helix domain-containing protein n=1 Tax=Parasporobacterium paucivorans DSM 15970 TaxID=1122934 RepID=A0A1M6DP10_9FIRM|nr:helix-turn-helix domain-containing protein [Parasporobacterium paucivorans]SHI74967.1 PucR C-terminal helix-turn-helix domain-containing protein [Parasporobacterium paucivorans DSM 15970]
MKISMWILADWLKKYKPDIDIKKGDLCLKDVRIFSQDCVIENKYVYLGRAKDFFSNKKNEIIVVNGVDLMLLQSTDIDEVFNSVLSAFEFYSDWYESQVELINKGCSLAGIISRNQLLLKSTIAVLDTNYRVTAIVPEETDGLNDEGISYMVNEKSLPMNWIIDSRKQVQRMHGSRDSFLIQVKEEENPFIFMNLYLRGRHYGWLMVITGGDKIPEFTRQLSGYFGRFIESWIQKNEESMDLQDFSNTIRRYLDGEESLIGEINRYFEIIGWHSDEPKAVIALSSSNSSFSLTETMISFISSSMENCYVMAYQDKILIINNLKIIHDEEFFRILKPWMVKGKFRCGVSFQFTDFKFLRQSFQQTQIALKYGKQKVEDVNYCKDYVLHYIVQLLEKENNMDIITHPALKQLILFDCSNNADLYHTLSNYISNDCNQIKTATDLNLHRNSLIYRIKKIQEITGIDFKDPATKAHLLISFLAQKEGD